MKDGGRYIERASERIQHEADLSNDEKTSLLTVLCIYTGIHDPERAREILSKAGRLMIDSPVYDWIRQEGVEEGRAEGKLEDAQRMLERGIDLATVLDVTGLSEDTLRERGVLPA